MLVTKVIPKADMKHVEPQQYGAFVVHCMGLQDFYSIQILPSEIQVSFSVPSQETGSTARLGGLEEAFKALGDLDPFPCLCGCGAFIAISPCYRQSGVMLRAEMTEEEHKFCSNNQKIQAIKSVRERTGLGLRDAKDICDRSYPTPNWPR